MNFNLPTIKALDQLKDPLPNREGIQKILGDDLQVYYVKNGTSREGARQLTNEFISNRFLNLWGVPTPVLAAVQPMTTEEESTDQNLGLGFRSLGKTSTELSSLFALRSQSDLKRLANPADLFKIGLFDIWLENRNRKESRLNLLINHERNQWKMYAIDHGGVLLDQPYSHLQAHKGVIQPFRESVLQSHLGRQIKSFFAQKGIGVFTRGYFFSLVQKCQDQFDAVLSEIPKEWKENPEELRQLRKFLFDQNRNEAVFDDFLVKLQ